MKVKYIEEHTSCFNYSVGENALVNIVNIKRGETINICPTSNLLVFCLKGDMAFSYGSHIDIPATESNILLHPANLKCKIQAKKDTTYICMFMNTDLSFCDHFSFEMLLQENDKTNQSEVLLHLLKSNDVINLYLKNLVNYLKDGLRCSYLLEIKIKEVLYLLNAYYTKEELHDFFRPILNNDLMFSMRVHNLYENNLSVKGLAALMNYSLSGFEKKFKKVFNVSANKWLQNKRAQSIYHDINCTTKTFSEMAYEYNFSSPAHFNAFCRRHFNTTPGTIRRRYISKK